MGSILYRAISRAELEDLRVTGRLRAAPSTCEGKHFACTLVAARMWGEALYGDGRFEILRVEFADDVFAELYAWETLDGIGAARFATIEQLEGIRAVEVVEDEPAS